MISFPSLYLSRSVTVSVQLLSSFNSLVAISFVPSVNVTFRVSCLLPSRSSSSSHTFSTDEDVNSGVCLFVIVYPLSESPSVVIEYVPGPSVPVRTSSFCSSTLYSISTPTLPASYFGRFVNVATQADVSPSSSFVPSNSIVSITLPFAFRSNFTESGLNPSWSSASSHTFVASTSIVSGV